MELIHMMRVRMDREQATAALERYVFGHMYGGPRAPRGIDPAYVSEYLRKFLEPDSEYEVFERALDVMRYYERADVVPVFLEALAVDLEGMEDVARGAYAVQALCDFGDEEARRKANEYFETKLVPHAEAIEAMGLLLRTRVATAPEGTVDGLEARLRKELSAAEEKAVDERSVMAYDRLASLLENDLPRAVFAISRKKELLKHPVEEQTRKLIEVYLGSADWSDADTEIWAGRKLRFEVMAGFDARVIGEFSTTLDAIAAGKVKGNDAALAYERAAQAILYFGGSLSDEHAAKYQEEVFGGMNFLWDDPFDRMGHPRPD